MRLINRSKQSPLGRRACDVALAAHHEKFGDYGRQKARYQLHRCSGWRKGAC